MLIATLVAACLQVATPDPVSIAEGLSRPWIGPTTFANRLGDWRLAAGRIECSQAAAAAPVRTLGLLDRFVDAEQPFALTVRTGQIDTDAEPRPEQWTGFLIGTGGEHVDYRTSALTHLRPATDGGLLCILTGDGQLEFRDFSQSAQGGGLWSLRGPLDIATVPALANATSSGAVTADQLREGVVLTLNAYPEVEEHSHANTWHLAFEARSAAGRVVASAQCERAPVALIDGSVGLVSHLGPAGSALGHWYDEWSTGGLHAAPERRFGPVLTTQYTVSNDVLRLTAQFPPLGPDDVWTASLEVRPVFRLGAGPPANVAGDWTRSVEAEIQPDSFTATFALPELDELNAVSPGSKERYPIDGVRYSIQWGGQPSHIYSGRIRAERTDDEPFVLAAFTGHKCYTGGLQWNSNGLWFPHADIVSAVKHHDPDLLFFSGDQIYESDLTPAITRPEAAALLDYQYKWQRWCWAFKELTRDRPTITIPDDHDVYHGNIWGAANVPAEPDDRKLSAQDRGGYKMSARFVNAVHRTQVGHLPEPANPEPLAGGITTYHTAVEFGGISFAVLADRMFKSSPSVAVPAGDFRNGWPQVEGFDPVADSDTEGAQLLGDDQLAFLDQWALDWGEDTWMKVCLSQTIFANVATLPGGADSGSVLPGLPVPAPGDYPEGYEVAADADSNGWPKSGRDRALRALRKGFALHVAGDQHLASTIQYGIDEWRDAGFAICVPSVANTWPRRWFPSQPGDHRPEGAPAYSGDFEDGFGNKLSVHAVANPVSTGVEPTLLHDRAPGYGIVTLDPVSRAIEMACWPRWADPADATASPYEGWPVRCTQLANGGFERPSGWWLPTLQFTDLTDPLLRIADAEGEVLGVLRIRGSAFRARTPGPGKYTIEVLDGATGKVEQRVEGLEAALDQKTTRTVETP